MKVQTKFSGKHYAVSIIVLATVGAIALLSLRNGFSGDQALFLIYSKAINSGAVYYRDIWDIKQPGIIYFYLIGGKLFGFTEIGIHLLELIYWLLFSVFLIFALRKYFSNPIFAVLSPLFTVGMYYTVSGSLHFTQVEALVAFPFFLTIWFSQKFLENPEKKRYLFWSGLAGGIALSLKLMLIIILAGFWLCLFVYLYRSGKRLREILRFNAPILIGMMIPVSVFVIYFAANGALGDLWYTTFIYPAHAASTVVMNERSYQLKTGLIWGFKSYFPVIFLTSALSATYLGVFFLKGRKAIATAFKIENFLITALFVWLILGYSVILAQKLSWWEYHYSLPMVPLGILSLKFFEIVISKIINLERAQNRLAAFVCLVVILAVIFIPTGRRFMLKVAEFSQPELFKIGEREALITGSALSDYRSISKDTEFLKNKNPKPPMFIISNPLYYYLSDSAPVFSSNGAMSDMFTSYEWERLNREMEEKPPKYIFIETRFLEPTAEKDPEFMRILRGEYTLHSTGDRGSFFQRLK